MTVPRYLIPGDTSLQISRFQTEVLKVLLYTSEGVPVIDKPFSFEKQVWNTNWVTFLRFPTEGGEARSVLAEVMLFCQSAHVLLKSGCPSGYWSEARAVACPH